MPILVLSMHAEEAYAERVLRVGAQGFVWKNAGAERILHAIRQVSEGGLCFSQSVAMRMLAAACGLADESRRNPGVAILSDREMAVFELMGQGRNSAEIAESLSLDVKTVEAHRLSMKRKLKVRSLAHLTSRAIRWVLDEQSGAAREAGLRG